MRKILAILMLALLVFNLAGYRFLFSYLEKQAREGMVAKLDEKAYDPGNIVEIKVALHLPYETNNKDFERFDGSIELNGFTYAYVERKVENDTLVLHCLPNKINDKIKLAFDEYGKAVNDVQSAQKNQKNNTTSLLLKSLVCNGFRAHNDYSYLNLAFIAQCAAYKTIRENVTDDKFSKSPEQPPDFL